MIVDAPFSIINGVESAQGWETPDEQHSLRYLAQRVPKSGLIVEIGSEFGMSTAILAKFSDESVDVLCIDPCDNDVHTHHVNTMKAIGAHNKVYYCRTTSEICARDYYNQPEIGYFEPRNIDLLFIDGDHSTDGVRKDIELWVSKLNIGGLAIFHDTLAPTNHRPHEQHAWVQAAIDAWQRGEYDTSDVQCVETLPYDSLRVFVRVK